ncbi:AMP-binding protein [Actinosynnema pretiosum]|uniref:Long-chain fatty acid--CoA ligase n=1 Tax=Actinosynnema pretiosum TaxID=42197 RepID=A0A290Z7P0_9PSEU|nr:AMP-binding protein [Actinosynnema pretiosum]ATE55004.1 long-chain fatty acid--CoA ligase [Actinosynnema pretiosum]
MSSSRTLVHVLLDHASERGDQVAYEFLHDDGRVSAMTYGELVGRAASVAGRVRAAGADGPALLLFPPGLDFVVAVWGCLLAGVPAVPAYPPLLGPAERVTERFARMLDDSGASVLLADPLVLGVLGTPDAGVPAPTAITLEGLEVASPDLDRLPRPDDVALVQYTSGSTSAPKGVVLEHRNLVANVEAISEVFALDRTTRAVSWLPPYHDMGLIGFILTPVHGGFPVRLMSPVTFLRDPLLWLRQISELGVTHTGGPNFAYDLCARRAGDEDLGDLDLSSWRLAFNGAEPIRPATLSRFTARFAAHGFRGRSFLPCYGLAEATLIVTGRRWSPSDGLVDGRVDCGPVVRGHRLAVVDPDTLAPRPDGVEGELLLAGPSVTRGYWNDTGVAEEELFAELDGERYLRTGDLGLLRAGNLVVTGRRKDVLIQHGVNHHAHDLEAAATAVAGVRPTAAAFTGAEEEVVVAVEVAASADADAVSSGVRERVLAATGVRVDAVVLCAPRSIPRTTSGKVQRSLARSRFLGGELSGRVVVAEAAPAADDSAVVAFFASVFAVVCEVPRCGPEQTLSSIGGDSIRAAEIAAVTEDALSLAVPVEVVLDAQSPRELTARLTALWAAEGVDEADVVARLSAV